MVKKKFGYDDSLDVFGVHGVGGFLGTIMCGVFASSFFGGNDADRIDYDITSQVVTQLKGAVSAAIYTMIATFVILKLVQLTIGLRVDGTSETRGLDLADHEERGYIL
jgi:Amt family ammonium transporter